MYHTYSNLYSANSRDLSGARRCRLTFTWTALQLSLTRLSTPVPFSACLSTSMQVHIAAGGSSLAHEDLSGASIIVLAWQCLFYGPTVECEISDSTADGLL